MSDGGTEWVSRISASRSFSVGGRSEEKDHSCCPWVSGGILRARGRFRVLRLSGKEEIGVEREGFRGVWTGRYSRDGQVNPDDTPR